MANLCFFRSPSFDSGAYLSQSNWTSLRGSGRRSTNSMYLLALIAWTKCPGMGGEAGAGKEETLVVLCVYCS